MKGTYVLIIENQADTEAKVGKIGCISFKRGFYAYVGSALSGLEQRIERHTREIGKNKKLHWHIDYFLASPWVEIKEVVCAETKKRKECEIALSMGMHMDSIARFGCTNCLCNSHLFFSTSLTELKKHVYKSAHAVEEHLSSVIQIHKNLEIKSCLS